MLRKNGIPAPQRPCVVEPVKSVQLVAAERHRIDGYRTFTFRAPVFLQPARAVESTIRTPKRSRNRIGYRGGPLLGFHSRVPRRSGGC